eukprot:10521389-Ditylum_brightwellii.AAC.1
MDDLWFSIHNNPAYVCILQTYVRSPSKEEWTFNSISVHTTIGMSFSSNGDPAGHGDVHMHGFWHNKLLGV